MCVLILNQLRHFRIPILVPVARKELKKASLKGRPLFRTNSSKIIFVEKITNFKAHLLQRDYPKDLIIITLSGEFQRQEEREDFVYVTFPNERFKKALAKDFRLFLVNEYIRKGD